MTIAAIEHVVIDDRGVPRVAGSRVRVSQIAAEWEAARHDAEAVGRMHPHLSPAKVYAAIAYYLDHVQPIQEELAASERAHAAAVAAQADDPTVAKLRAAREDGR